MNDSKLGLSGSQTIGPFFKYGLAWTNGERAFPESAAGEKIEITGQVLDGAGSPINDAMIEFWQADAGGAFGGPTPGSCAGFARCYTSPEGRYVLHTRKPGAVAGTGAGTEAGTGAGTEGESQAPYILVCLFSRGMLAQVYTRLYFGDEAANAQDAVLKAAGARAGTLIARAGGPGQYAWDIVVQGARETVFLDL